MATSRKVPDLGDVVVTDHHQLRRFLEAVREIIQTREGHRGTELQRGVLFGDLVDMGLVARSGAGYVGVVEGIPGPPGPPGSAGEEYTPDLTPPPSAVFVDVVEGFSYLIVQWEAPVYTEGNGHAYTEVWAAQYSGTGDLPTFANAVLVAKEASNIYAHQAGLDVQVHFWLVNRSNDDVPQTTPTGGLNGEVGQTQGLPIDHLLDVITANLVAVYATIGSLVADQITSAEISVSKLTAGSLAVGADISSAGFVPGSAGWIIRGNNTAEFPAIGIRGQLTAAQINSNGLSIRDTSGNVILSAGATVASSTFGGNATGSVGGVAASTVVDNAANGNTAFSGTSQYRATGVPTNNPTPTGITITANTNGTVNIRLDWAAYTQGALKADMLLLFWRQDGSAPTVNDASIAFNVNTTGASYYIFEGVNPAGTYSAGIAAARRTENGLEVGAIQAPTSSPDWRGVTHGTPNYTANIAGTAAATVATNASTALANAAAAQGDADAAQLAADAANAAVADMASDGKLTPVEKQATKSEWDVLVAEKAGLNTQASNFSITTENTAYNNWYALLDRYLNNTASLTNAAGTVGAGSNMLSSLTTTSDLDKTYASLSAGAAFRKLVADFYTARQVLLNKIAEVASTRAAWANVTGTETITSQAANGQAAFTGTANLRSNSPPTNNAAFDTMTKAQTADGNVTVTVPYTYSQSTLQAEFLLVYVREGGGTVTTANPAYATNPVNGSMTFVLKPSTTYTFGLAAVRTSEGGYQSTPIVTSSSITTDASNFTGNIDGQSAATLKANATNALADAADAQLAADAANAAVNDMAADNKLTPLEKQSVRAEWDVLYAERAGLIANATAVGVTTESTNYQAALNTLGTYLNAGVSYTASATRPSWINDAGILVTTDIVGNTFRSNVATFFTSRQALLNKIAEIASTKAIWASVTGAGRPADNATANSNLSGAGAPAAGTGINGDSYYDTTNKLLYAKWGEVWTRVGAGEINSGNAATYIASAAIGDAQIGNLAAGKITAGTITAAVSLSTAGYVKADGGTGVSAPLDGTTVTLTAAGLYNASLGQPVGLVALSNTSTRTALYGYNSSTTGGSGVHGLGFTGVVGRANEVTNAKGGVFWAAAGVLSSVALSAEVPATNTSTGGVAFRAVANAAGQRAAELVSTSGTALSIVGHATCSGLITSTRSSGDAITVARPIVSTLATGTAPFTVSSTTMVANLKAASAGNADTLLGLGVAQQGGWWDKVAHISSTGVLDGPRYIDFQNANTNGLSIDYGARLYLEGGSATGNGYLKVYQHDGGAANQGLTVLAGVDAGALHATAQINDTRLPNQITTDRPLKWMKANLNGATIYIPYVQP